MEEGPKGKFPATSRPASPESRFVQPPEHRRHCFASLPTAPAFGKTYPVNRLFPIPFRLFPVLSLALSGWLAAVHAEEGTSRGLPPEEALASFQLAEGFQIELMAAEPLIADPVAMEIDEQGRLYVVQMHGYPLDKDRTGVVKLLTDSDGDGRLDQSTVFADGLRFPNGVMRWKQGILVTDAPDLWYLEDTDGDGVADRREVMLTGFALSNPQHIVNSPMLGLDNWIYLANEPATTPRIYVEEFGDPGDEVCFPGDPAAPRLARNANGRRVRLRPDEQRLEALSSSTQFGHTTDPWGRHLLVSNARHIFHEVIQARYLDRNPALLIPGAVASVAKHGDAAEVFPITEKPEHQMLTSVGVFTSACGNVFYQGGLFPAPFDRVHFVAEPVGNLVHAEIVEEQGATFSASRLDEKKEFLASRDAWFRPVNHYIGPDGALYVVDYYRRIIEHPEWMAKEVAESSSVRDGIDQGRLYRITPKGTAPATWMQGTGLEAASTPELVDLLGHANIWHRRNAQRLLLDRYREEAPPSLLKSLANVATDDERPYARPHAAWTLEGLGALTPEVVGDLLRDEVPGIRENALILAEPLLAGNPALHGELLALRDDPNGRVRFQWLCTLGEIDSPEAGQLRNQLLFANIDDPWMQAAALSARKLDYDGLLAESIRRSASTPEQWRPLIERLATMRSTQAGADEVRDLLLLATSEKSHAPGPWQAAVLAGVAKGGKAGVLADPSLEAVRLRLLEQVLHHPRGDVRQASLAFLVRAGLPQGEALEGAKAQAVATIQNREADVADRTISIAFLAAAQPEASQALLLDLLQPAESTAIQKAALAALSQSGGDGLAEAWIARWPSLTDGMRSEVILALLPSAPRRAVLINALEKGAIAPAYVTGSHRVRLIAQSDRPTRDRLRAIFSTESKDEERAKVIDSYRAALASSAQDASPDRGKLVYQNQCSACHPLGGQHGTPLGPDLNSIRIREPEAILTDILDPNRSIADGYTLWQITLQDGVQKIGIIGSETTTSLTLRAPGAPEETIARQDIAYLKDLGISLMPTGLEHLIPPQDMADLIAFIQNPD